jgi:hypothetical protein
MPFCPKCGKEVSSEAAYCYYCGQSLPKIQSVPIEPKISEVPKIEKEVPPPPKTVKTRNFAIIALVLIVVIVFAGVYFGTSFLNKSNLFFPTTFQNVVVQGDPSQSVYTITFSLANEKGVTGAFNGTLLFEITDFRNHVLYESSFPVYSAAFTKNSFGNLVYSWSFPTSNVEAGVPEGLATLSFSTANGTLFSSENYDIDIPTLPNVWINGSLTFLSDSTTQLSLLVPEVLRPLIYANDSFIQTFQVESTGPSVTITNIATTTPGFTVLSITPQTPFVVGSTYTDVTLNISTPSQYYYGPLGFFIYTQSQIQIPGSLAIDSYSITSATTVTVYVRNVGTTTLILTNAYVDGAVQGLIVATNPVAPSAVAICAITVTGINLADGTSHSLKVVASDGTQVAIAIVVPT